MKADYSERARKTLQGLPRVVREGCFQAGEVLGAESKAGPRQQGLALLLPHPGTNGNLRESRPLIREEVPCSPDVLHVIRIQHEKALPATVLPAPRLRRTRHHPARRIRRAAHLCPGCRWC